MKAKITLVTDLKGTTAYHIFADGDLIKVYGFKEDAPEGDLYNKKLNYDQAMDLAMRIEKAVNGKVEEVIYETGAVYNNTVTNNPQIK